MCYFKPMGHIMRNSILAALGLAAVIASGSATHATELKLIVATPLTNVVRDLGNEFERSTGTRLIAKFVSGPIVKQEIDAGGQYDVVISITPVIDALIREGKLRADTRADVAHAVVGVGVRSGAAKPDITTVEAFTKALLEAKRVAHSATGVSGDHFRSIIQRLKIADQMQPKLRPMPADTIAQAVPSGQADMIVVTASVIMAPGMDYVGPIPAELQFYNTFAAAVGSHVKDEATARSFLKLLSSAQAFPVLKAHGMIPGLPN